MIADRLKEIEGKRAPHLQVAESAVATAKAYFEACGFQVFDIADVCKNGRDMTIAKNGQTLRVEVKSASFSKRSYKTTPVKTNRQQDDLVAIVIGTNVIVQPMKDHLACCGADGTRRITDLVYWTNLSGAKG